MKRSHSSGVETVAYGGCALATFLMFATSFAGWITHVVFCIQHEKWGFLIAGALAFPVGIIHGFGLWFGWWH